MLSADKTESVSFDENTLYYFDFVTYSQTLEDTASQYDLANLLTTLQGLVNRETPRVFINYTTDNGYSKATDKFWLEALRRDGYLRRNFLQFRRLSADDGGYSGGLDGSFLHQNQPRPVAVGFAFRPAGQGHEREKYAFRRQNRIRLF